ncbi:MAG: glycerophosphodiester phosphodiesterase [Alphaproteobacteria bacterium]|nr:glycerophosphodiester phosphodiesterase [Alphaproteobacteria bacterium]MYE59057.1 glycerophosphodiester phosphodiesterase [Alphaproteobacteria bacterium]
MTRDLHPFLRHPGYPLPAAIAHRGYSARYPENTMAAFAAAVELGYRIVETDVHATADNVLVVFHDSHLDRLTDRQGALSEMDWPELRRVRVAGREPIPRLEELLTTWDSLRVNIDPKQDGAVGPLLDVLRDTDAWDRVCVGSASSARLRRIRAAAGDRLCTSMGTAEVVRLWLSGHCLPLGGFAADCVQVPTHRYGVPVIDRAFMAAAHARSLPVHAWTINGEAEMNRLLDLGVDGIMTDEAELLKEVFERRDIWTT